MDIDFVTLQRKKISSKERKISYLLRFFEDAIKAPLIMREAGLSEAVFET